MKLFEKENEIACCKEIERESKLRRKCDTGLERE